MYQQSPCRLCAAWAMKEIMNHENIKRTLFKTFLKEVWQIFFASGGSADVLMNREKRGCRMT
jgi:hypothetical protein